jgi:hypothetical protein
MPKMRATMYQFWNGKLQINANAKHKQILSNALGEIRTITF